MKPINHRLHDPRFLVACACLAAPVALAAPVPDVVPGIPNRYPVVKIFTGPPLAVWLDGHPRCQRLLAGPLADHSPRAVLDPAAGCSSPPQAPGDLTVAVRRVPGTSGLSLVELGRAPGDLRRYYLVRRSPKHTTLVCRFAAPGPPGSLGLRLLGRSPFRFEVAAPGSNPMAYTVDRAGLCRPSLPAGPPTDFAYENAFAQAQMLLGLEQWADAGVAHARVLHLRESGAHAEESALGAITARSNYLDLQCFPPEGDLEPQPIEGVLADKIRSLDDYLRLFPHSPQAPKIALRKASDLYGCNRLEEAAALYRGVAERPADPLAQSAREMYGHVEEAIKRRNEKRAMKKPP